MRQISLIAELISSSQTVDLFCFQLRKTSLPSSSTLSLVIRRRIDAIHWQTTELHPIRRLLVIVFQISTHLVTALKVLRCCLEIPDHTYNLTKFITWLLFRCPNQLFFHVLGSRGVVGTHAVSTVNIYCCRSGILRLTELCTIVSVPCILCAIMCTNGCHDACHRVPKCVPLNAINFMWIFLSSCRYFLNI